MSERASTTLYWPNYRADIVNHRAACTTCSKYQPSNPAMPPVIQENPVYPFQSICADFFTVNSWNYLTIVDRFSNWLSIFKLDKDNSEELIKILREYIAIFGIPVTFTSDGAKVFTSKIMEDFFHRYGIIHRITTSYNPRSNKRAEVAVKSSKRLIRDNLTETGDINNDNMARALLLHRNTPCPLTGLSPAQIVYGRVLRDFLPLQPGKFIPRQEWRQAAEDRAAAYSKRVMQKAVDLSRGARQQVRLSVGQPVLIQDQNKASRTYKQWTRTGTVVQVGNFDDYHISVDGSRHITKRNRQFLKPIKPAPDVFSNPSPQPAPPRSSAPVPPTHVLPLPTPPVAQSTQDKPARIVPEDTGVHPQEMSEVMNTRPPQPTPATVETIPPLHLKKTQGTWTIYDDTKISNDQSQMSQVYAKDITQQTPGPPPKQPCTQCNHVSGVQQLPVTLYPYPFYTYLPFTTADTSQYSRPPITC